MAAGCNCSDGGQGAPFPDGASGYATEGAGLVPDRVAVPLPDSVQVSRRCTSSSAQGQVEEMVKHVERTQEYALAQIRVVDVLIGAALDSQADDIESEPGAFLVEVSQELAAGIAPTSPTTRSWRRIRRRPGSCSRAPTSATAATSPASWPTRSTSTATGSRREPAATSRSVT